MSKVEEKEVVNKLKNIFEKLLNIKINKFDQLVFGKSKNWDSLKHLEIIINIEKEFSIRVKTSDISKLKSFTEIKKYIFKVANF